MNSADADFESGELAFLTSVVEERIPFNHLLGIKLVSIEPSNIKVAIKMRDELVGNFTLRTLHGGVISSVLDAAGGMMVSYSLFQRIADLPSDEQMRRFARIGTIDLRVDYLRPGRGERFVAGATTLRTGNKVAVTRMEMRDDKNRRIAVGTGTYIVG
ncbi:MAG: thioesterase family protein [Anaerolineales bacterium]